MSGHSKWSTIKHKKAAQDAKRGRLFTKIIRELTVAARMGGADPASNPRLRSALASAQAANMPKDNIQRAIQRGTGELEGVSYEEIVYEGYGPGGVAIYVEALTDNRNRTTSEVRHLFSKHGGDLGAPNSVAWMFEKKGWFLIDGAETSEDALMEATLDAGAEDIRQDGDTFELLCPVDGFEPVREALEGAGIRAAAAEIRMVPSNTVRIEGKKARQLITLLEGLEDQDDVQKVSDNSDMDEAELEA
jgi:YebC/PmpR family DNA-binding regulatory protein